MISGKPTNLWPPDGKIKSRYPIHYTEYFCWTLNTLFYDFTWVPNDPRVKDVSHLSVDVHLDPLNAIWVALKNIPAAMVNR
jgi:hypothetical protein